MCVRTRSANVNTMQPQRTSERVPGNWILGATQKQTLSVPQNQPLSFQYSVQYSQILILGFSKKKNGQISFGLPILVGPLNPL